MQATKRRRVQQLTHQTFSSIDFRITATPHTEQFANQDECEYKSESTTGRFRHRADANRAHVEDGRDERQHNF